MPEQEYIHDIICQVLIEKKSIEVIYDVLNEFIPGYQAISSDYAGKPEDDTYVFSSEYEMLNYYIETLDVSQSFYWNKSTNNPDRIMVGANITDDNQIVFSLTFNGSAQTEAHYHLKLKRYLNSEVGVISYVNPVGYDNGADFKKRYQNTVYAFEK